MLGYCNYAHGLASGWLR